ncbi:hypothetical protein ES705_09689 [subsurface metagenome]
MGKYQIISEREANKEGVRYEKSEDRSRKTEAGRQKPEVRSRKSEAGSRKSEVRGHTPFFSPSKGEEII